MLNLGLTEIIVVLVVAIVIVGPERLPTVVRWLGRQYGKLIRSSDELRKAFVIEADRAEAEDRARIEAARADPSLNTARPRDLKAPFPTHDDEEGQA